jgi:predicted transport protein
MNDGKFELVVLKNIDPTIFAKLLRNIPLESGDVEIISTDRANINYIHRLKRRTKNAQRHRQLSCHGR